MLTHVISFSIPSQVCAHAGRALEEIYTLPQTFRKTAIKTHNKKSIAHLSSSNTKIERWVEKAHTFSGCCQVSRSQKVEINTMQQKLDRICGHLDFISFQGSVAQKNIMEVFQDIMKGCFFVVDKNHNIGVHCKPVGKERPGETRSLVCVEATLHHLVSSQAAFDMTGTWAVRLGRVRICAQQKWHWWQ